MYKINYLEREKFSLNYFILFFIIPFSGYYITKLPFSPIYFFIGFGFYLASILIFITNRVKLNNINLLAFIVIIYFLFSQFIFCMPTINTLLNFIFSILVFIVVYSLLSTISLNNIINLSKYLIYFSLPLLIIESIYRIINPPVEKIDLLVNAGREDIMFYIYKFNSIMYQDSNFVGLFILSLFFFLLYLKQYTCKKYYLSFFILTILLFATISRASIFSIVVFSFLYVFRQIIYENRKLIFFVSLILAFILFPILFEYRMIDDSFSTKFEIIDKTIEYLSKASLTNLLFGVGFGNAVEVLDMGAHNFFVIYLVESGFIGLILIVILWTYILLKTKYKAGIVMFPFLLNGLSLATGAIPYLYVMFALILVLESRKNQIGK